MNDQIDGPMTPGSDIGRLLTALLTPCDPNSGAVDYAAIGPLVDHQVAHGVTGLFILGTAGQGPLLTMYERKQLVRETVSAAAGRLTLVVHVGAASQADTLDLAIDAAGAGATALASVPPAYYSPDPKTVGDYYRALIERVGRPIYAYDNPRATGYCFGVDELADLHANGLAGVKVARTDFLFMQSLIGRGVPTWVANADLNAAALLAGAHGAISTITNVAPALFHELAAAVERADVSRAFELQRRVLALAEVVRTPIIGALHHGGSRLGLPTGAPRRPLRLPDEVEIARIDAALRVEELA